MNYIFALVVLIFTLFNVSYALYSAKSAVVDANDKSFNSEVKRHDGIVIVEFYAPWCGHCKNLAPEYDKAASNLKGVAKVVAVDATQSPSVAQRYGVQGYPTIKVFGADKTKPEDYQGARTADGITTEVMKHVNKLVKTRKSGGASSGTSRSSSSGSGSGNNNGSGSKRSAGNKKAVIELTDANFNALVMESTDHWLVEFYAPWCGHCKALAPEWEEAAKQLKGNVKLGAVDATVHQSLASQYQIKGFPTIKIFSAGKNKKAQDYNGPREATGIVEYAMHTLDKAGVPPQVSELTSQAVFEDKCESGSTICVVMFVPHILDTGKKGRNEYMSAIQHVSMNMRGKPIQWLWSEANSQEKFEAAFDVNNNYPTIVVLSAEKKAAATMRISWNVQNILTFINGVFAGKEKILPVEGGIPKLNKIKKWDGKDGVPPEEVPLSEIFGDDEL